MSAGPLSPILLTPLAAAASAAVLQVAEEGMRTRTSGSPFGKERAARTRRLSHVGPDDSSSRRSAGSRHPSTVTPVGLAGPPAQNETAQAKAGAGLDCVVRTAEPRDASP